MKKNLYTVYVTLTDDNREMPVGVFRAFSAAGALAQFGRDVARVYPTAVQIRAERQASFQA